jgi:hypothetical protein
MSKFLTNLPEFVVAVMCMLTTSAVVAHADPDNSKTLMMKIWRRFATV